MSKPEKQTANNGKHMKKSLKDGTSVIVNPKKEELMQLKMNQLLMNHLKEYGKNGVKILLKKKDYQY